MDDEANGGRTSVARARDERCVLPDVRHGVADAPLHPPPSLDPHQLDQRMMREQHLRLLGLCEMVVVERLVEVVMAVMTATAEKRRVAAAAAAGVVVVAVVAVAAAAVVMSAVAAAGAAVATAEMADQAEEGGQPASAATVVHPVVVGSAAVQAGEVASAPAPAHCLFAARGSREAAKLPEPPPVTGEEAHPAAAPPKA